MTMFVKTISFNKKTAMFGVILAAVLLLAIIIVSANGKSDSNHSIFDFGSNLKTNEGRIAYLAGCGWEVEPEPVETKSILIPKEFSDVLKEYNEMQMASGFDLTEYAGLTVEQYTYRVTNYDKADCDVNATLYIYNFQVIGGDIHSTSIDGFMHGLK